VTIHAGLRSNERWQPEVLRYYELCRAAQFDAFRDSLNGVFYPA
jgi:hypothetical protein